MPNLTPDELLEIHKDYADQFASLAQSGLVSAFSQLAGSGMFEYHPGLVTIKTPQIGEPKPAPEMPERPIPPRPEKMGTLENYMTIPNPGYGSGPPNTLGPAPEYFAPPQPGTAPPFTLTPPVIQDTITLPPGPIYLSLPALALPYPTIDLPPAPTITMPIFDGRRPDDINMVDPQEIIAQYRTEQNDHRNMLPAYVEAHADALFNKYAPDYAAVRSRINGAVLDYTDPINGGGMGIPANIEGAIVARNSDRNGLEFQRALSTASETLSKQGFSIPPGALLSTLRQARMAMGDAQVRGSVELATKNLELEQQNFQIMLKLGQELEGKMMETLLHFVDLTLKMDELSISSAKEIVSAYVGAYNVQAVVYQAMWTGYQSDASVYRSKIDSLMAQVNIFEAQIKAELAKTEVNTAHVNVLRAVADVNTSLANTYKVQIDAALAPLQLAQVQTALYEAQVRGFAAQVGVYESYWSAYKAQIEGELGKFRAFEAQAQAYTAQVTAYRAQCDGYSAQVQGLAAANQAKSSANEGIIKEFSVQSEVALKTFEALIAAYGAESNIIIKQTEIEIEYWRAKAGFIMNEWQVVMNQMFEYAREQMNLFRGQMEAAISAGNGLAQAAQVAGSLASGAMSGLTSMAARVSTDEV
jgi:hypothetical protein